MITAQFEISLTDNNWIRLIVCFIVSQIFNFIKSFIFIKQKDIFAVKCNSFFRWKKKK